jgi:hypothetical protein
MERKLEIMQAKAHKPRLVLSHHVHKTVHGENAMGRFNTQVAVKVTKSVGSMWCAYVFAAIALISLPAAISSHQAIIIVAWIAQTFLQLVLLPIIIVGQNVQAEASDARAESDHETLISIHTLTSEVHTIAERQTKMLEILEKRVEASE